MKKEFIEPRARVRYTVKDLMEFRNNLKIGQAVEIQVVAADTGFNAPPKKKVRGIVVMKYPYHCMVRYPYRGKLWEKSVQYVQLMIGDALGEEENK